MREAEAASRIMRLKAGQQAVIGGALVARHGDGRLSVTLGGVRKDYRSRVQAARAIASGRHA